jgi:hypothetical protein
VADRPRRRPLYPDDIVIGLYPRSFLLNVLGDL